MRLFLIGGLLVALVLGHPAGVVVWSGALVIYHMNERGVT